MCLSNRHNEICKNVSLNSKNQGKVDMCNKSCNVNTLEKLNTPMKTKYLFIFT